MPRGGKPGNRGGQKGRSGRKPRTEEAAALSFWDQHWPEADRIAAVKRMHDQAMTGDTRAFSILAAYAWGKPKEQIEHSGSLETGQPVLNVILTGTTEKRNTDGGD